MIIRPPRLCWCHDPCGRAHRQVFSCSSAKASSNSLNYFKSDRQLETPALGDRLQFEWIRLIRPFVTKSLQTLALPIPSFSTVRQFQTMRKHETQIVAEEITVSVSKYTFVCTTLFVYRYTVASSVIFIFSISLPILLFIINLWKSSQVDSYPNLVIVRMNCRVDGFACRLSALCISNLE